MSDLTDPVAGEMREIEGRLLVWTGSRWLPWSPSPSYEELRVRVEKLEAVIRKVLDDEESRPGGWGPDVTAVGWLKEALE